MTALSITSPAFASDLSDDQSHYLLAVFLVGQFILVVVFI